MISAFGTTFWVQKSKKKYKKLQNKLRKILK